MRTWYGIDDAIKNKSVVGIENWIKKEISFYLDRIKAIFDTIFLVMFQDLSH